MKSYRFFALEADRGTMPVSRSKPGRTSYLGKLAAYQESIAQQRYKAHWGIPNLLVLTVITNPARLSDILRELGDGIGSKAFLIKAMDERILSNPVPQLLSEPWERAGSPPLSIGE